MKEPLDDKVANKKMELSKIIFGHGFGGITDLEVGPDGYLYVLALQQGRRKNIPSTLEQRLPLDFTHRN